MAWSYHCSVIAWGEISFLKNSVICLSFGRMSIWKVSKSCSALVNERLYIIGWLEPAPKRQKHYAPCIGLSTKFSCHGKKHKWAQWPTWVNDWIENWSSPSQKGHVKHLCWTKTLSLCQLQNLGHRVNKTKTLHFIRLAKIRIPGDISPPSDRKVPIG